MATTVIVLRTAVTRSELLVGASQICCTYTELVALVSSFSAKRDPAHAFISHHKGQGIQRK